MVPFKIFVAIVFLITISMQVKQLADFAEWRGSVIEALYVAIILSLLFSTDFLSWD
jgi:hypothetical protein